MLVRCICILFFFALIGCDDDIQRNEAMAEPVYDFSELDEAPILRSQHPFYIPATLRSASFSGDYLFEIELDQQGNVVQAETLTAPNYRLAHYLISDIQSRGFSAPIKDGHPVRAKAKLPVPVHITAENNPVPPSASSEQTPAANKILTETSANLAEAVAREKAEQYIEFGELDQPPKLLDKSPLQFPDIIRRSPRESLVVLYLEMDERGNITKSAVAKTDDPYLGEIVREQISQRRFSPPTFQGKPVKATAHLPVPISIQ